jgi:hypothetical protein
VSRRPTEPPRPIRPLDSSRNSFELYLLILGLVTGAPLLWGAPPPMSAAALLDPVQVKLWAVLLVGGCFVALIGVWWTWWAWLARFHPGIRPSLATGLLLEQVGLVAVAVGTIIFAYAIVAVGGSPLVAGLVLGFGLACATRAVRIRRWVKASIRQQDDGP